MSYLHQLIDEFTTEFNDKELKTLQKFQKLVSRYGTLVYSENNLVEPEKIKIFTIFEKGPSLDEDNYLTKIFDLLTETLLKILWEDYPLI